MVKHFVATNCNASSGVAGALASHGPEVLLLKKIAAADQQDLTQFRKARKNFSPVQLSEALIRSTSGRAGSCGKYPIDKVADALVGAAVIMESPMLCDGMTHIATFPRSEVMAYHPASASATSNVVFTHTSGAVATGSLVPQQIFAVPATNAFVVGDIAEFTFGGGGRITAVALSTGTVDAVAAILSVTSYSGEISGVVTFAAGWAEGTAPTLATPATLGTDSGFLVAGQYTWSLSKDAKVDDQLLTASDWVPTANANVYYDITTAFDATDLGTPGTAITTSTTLANIGVVPTFAAIDEDDHDAYYVNGAPCAAISRFKLRYGGACPIDCDGVSARVYEKIMNPSDKVQSGAVSNFGSAAELKKWAHKLPATTATSLESRQVFAYNMKLGPFASPQQALLLNAIQGSSCQIEVDFHPLNKLVRAGDAVAKETEAASLYCRAGDHSATTTAINSSTGNAEIEFSILALYATMARAEREKYSKNSHVLVLSTTNDADRAKEIVSDAASTSDYTLRKVNLAMNNPSKWMVAAARCPMDKVPTTNGSGDLFNFKRSVATPTTADVESSTSAHHCPVVRAVTLKTNSAQRFDELSHEASCVFADRLLPGGAGALSDGLIFMPHEMDPSNLDEHKGGLDMSQQDNFSLDYYICPGTPANYQLLSIAEQTKTVFVSGGCATLAYA